MRVTNTEQSVAEQNGQSCPKLYFLLDCFHVVLPFYCVSLTRVWDYIFKKCCCSWRSALLLYYCLFLTAVHKTSNVLLSTAGFSWYWVQPSRSLHTDTSLDAEVDGSMHLKAICFSPSVTFCLKMFLLLTWIYSHSYFCPIWGGELNFWSVLILDTCTSMNEQC